MKTSKTLELIKLLNDKELAAFFKHVKPLGVGKGSDAMQLFYYFKRFAPDYSSNRLSRQMVCRHLFPKKEIASSRLNKIAFQLSQLLENFLIYYDLEHDVFSKKQLLLKSLQRRNYPVFSTESKKIINQISSKKLLTTKDHLRLSELNYDLWSDINTEKIDSDELLMVFKSANDQLDQYYFQQKLKILIEHQALQVIREVPFDLPKKDRVIQLVENHFDLKKYPLIALLLLALELLETPTETIYNTLKSTLFRVIEKITKADARDILLVLNNHISRNLGSKPTPSINESFDLFCFADKHQLLLENGRIRDMEFVNPLKVALFLGETIWATSFVERYTKFLKTDIQEIMEVYAYTLIDYKKGNFAKVSSVLNKIEFSPTLNLGIAIPIRTLKLRANYDDWAANKYSPEKEHRVILSLTNSFERYIRTHKKLSKSKKQAYIAFTYFLKKITFLAIDEYSLENKLLLMKEELRTEPVVTHRSWLIARMQELQKNLSH